MARWQNNETGVIDVPAELDAMYAGRPGWTRYEEPDELLILDKSVAERKGGDLDAALDAADLPKTGSADEKRARLKEALDA